MNSISSRLLYLIFSLLGLVYVIGWLVPNLMDYDTTQYALISMQMVQDLGLFLTPKYREIEYLDKPPLLFWLSVPSMMTFGINHFAYRLPSVLSTIFGTYCTYKFGKSLYNKNTGILAAILMAGNQAYVLSNHDVRTDAILANLMAFIIWQLYEYFQTNKTSHFVWSFVGIGLAMLQKGPIGMMVPIMAFGPHFVMNKQWKNLFRWQWIPGLAIVLLILAPMTYGLYLQHGNVGVKFFYWTQSFGRITGENEWKDDSDKLFFVHSFVWSFIPWMFLAIFAYFKRLINIVRHKFNDKQELITISGFTLVMVAMSMSSYKLPHYIYVSWVFIAVLTANEINNALVNNGKLLRGFIKTQYVVNILLWSILGVLVIWAFPMHSVFIWMVVAACFATSIYFSIQKTTAFAQLVLPSILTFVGVNVALNGHFYPALEKYQSGSEFAAYLQEKELDSDKVYGFIEMQNSLEFYYGKIFDMQSPGSLKAYDGEEMYLFVAGRYKKELDATEIPYEVIDTFPDFHITTLTPEFINPATRESTIETYYFVRLKPRL